MKDGISWEDIRKTLPEEMQDRLNEKQAKREQQTSKWIDLSVQNAFDRAKENGYDFIKLGTPTKEIAIDMKDKDVFFRYETLEDIEDAIERYKARI